HALEAAEDILQRVVERMPHMERAGDVRWRDDDAVGLSAYSIRPAGAESACVLPFLVDPLLDFGRLVGLLEHGSPGPDYKSRKVQGVLRPAFLTCQHKRACWGPEEVSPPKYTRSLSERVPTPFSACRQYLASPRQMKARPEAPSRRFAACWH